MIIFVQVTLAKLFALNPTNQSVLVKFLRQIGYFN